LPADIKDILLIQQTDKLTNGYRSVEVEACKEYVLLYRDCDGDTDMEWAEFVDFLFYTPCPETRCQSNFDSNFAKC